MATSFGLLTAHRRRIALDLGFVRLDPVDVDHLIVSVAADAVHGSIA